METENLVLSSGVDYIKDGYIDYAQEVIKNRALANLYDGLKPVHRRILVTLKEAKSKTHVKSQTITGNTMHLHPHGDSPIYQAMVLMTDTNGSLAFPLADGMGNLGKVYKSDPPAAARYTNVKLHPNAEEYFGEMNGIDMIPNYDSTTTEPDVLPVSFPSILVNASSGIAVGFKSNIPSFNFKDVCNLVIEYIDKGVCTTIIEPDFVTGGYYIKNNKELQKLMQAGMGKIKLRAKTVVDGKRILVTEVPFTKTTQRLIKQINNLPDASIKNAYDKNDFSGQTLLAIDCTSKQKVDEVYYSLIKNTDLQFTYNADLTVIQDGVPKRLGVWRIIEEWVKWRRNVLTREYTYRRDNLKLSIEEAHAFMNIVKAKDKCLELVNIIVKEGRNMGEVYIRTNFTREEVPEHLISLCASRRLPDYNDGGKYRDIYNNGMSQLVTLNNTLSNVDLLIKQQMQDLIRKYANKLPRKTEVTNKDYDFTSDDKKEKVVDQSSCVYELKNNFLKKIKSPTQDKSVEYRFVGKANDTLIAFDNRGRLLRVYCSDISLSNNLTGTYLPNYFNLEETEDYKIMWIGRMQGQELMLLYKDGNIGFVDTKEWDNSTRNVKVLTNGISSKSAPYLGAVLEEIPEAIIVTDTVGNIGWATTENIIKKDRTARTRMFALNKGVLLDTYSITTVPKVMAKLLTYTDCNGRLRPLRDINNYRGRESDFKPFF